MQSMVLYERLEEYKIVDRGGEGGRVGWRIEMKWLRVSSFTNNTTELNNNPGKCLQIGFVATHTISPPLNNKSSIRMRHKTSSPIHT